MTTPSPLASCFISYNHADKPLAVALAAGLKSLGYRVWIDEGELRVGDSLIAAISQAIGQVDFLAALVSEHSIASNWCQKELSLAMTEEVTGRGLTVLPCKVGDVDMPPALVDKVYTSMERDRVPEAVQRLHRDMQSHLTGTTPLPPRRRSATDLSPSTNGDAAELSALDQAKDAIAYGRRPLATLDYLGTLTDTISESKALADRTFNTENDNTTARERRVTIFQSTTEAAALTMFLCAHADERDYRRALESMRHLGQWPIGHGGATVLLTQQQAPGLLLLAAGGVGAVSEERWDLVKHLLSSVRVMTATGEAPLATGVDLSNALAGKTSFTQDSPMSQHGPTLVHDYLAAVNGAHKVMPRRAFDDAWERWEYIWQAAACNANGRLLGVPHLSITGRSHHYEAQSKGWADTLAAAQPSLRELLGEPGVPRAFDAMLAEVAQRAAWSTIPRHLAGTLPGSGWRVDEIGEYAVPEHERMAWKDLLPSES
ncbi:toll/interleukin-1 receptor domain-containing protein [uncultured Nocardioides sp.]|uniref:toll/interleukin-1 receptor domain-containing protein n=1 Tax=uncultured Nocardioides sp. TaxID=198441 RepID=UPI002634986B|nr:toll/interleukin-1 receptor domain-containing protein [uncultured Nocardioides sp.]